MDPTIEFTEVNDSRLVPPDVDVVYPPGLTLPKAGRVFPDYKYIHNPDIPKTNKYIDNESGPYTPSKIGNSIFSDFDAVKLANLDSIFKFTKRQSKQELKQYDYMVINPNKGGYHQYLQYRMTQSYGYSISTNITKKLLDRSIIDVRTERFFEIIGNITVTEVQSKITSSGLDLIISNKNTTRFKNIEFFITELSLCLHTLKGNGTWIIQLSDVDIPIKDCIYLSAIVFDKITLFKPMASNYNEDIYLVCQGPKDTYIGQIDNILADIKKQIKNKKYYPKTLFVNNPITSYIDSVLSISLAVDLSKTYRYEKSLILWTLPGTPEPGINVLKYPEYGETREGNKHPSEISLDDLQKGTITFVIERSNSKMKIPDIAMNLPQTTSPTRIF